MPKHPPSDYYVKEGKERVFTDEEMKEMLEELDIPPEKIQRILKECEGEFHELLCQLFIANCPLTLDMVKVHCSIAFE